MTKLFTVLTLILMTACASEYSYNAHLDRPLTSEERAELIRQHIEYNNYMMATMNQMNAAVGSSLKYFEK